MSNPHERGRALRKERDGVVVSKSGSKSVVVKVERRKQHPVYGKTMRTHRKFHVHDEENTAGVGDKVRIAETRPLSKMKRWRLVKIKEHQAGAVETAEEAGSDAGGGSAPGAAAE